MKILFKILFVSLMSVHLMKAQIHWKKIDWTAQDWLNAVATNGSNFVAVGWDGLVYTSNDAKQWSVRSTPTMETLYSVAWSGESYVAVGWHGAIIFSTDGNSWQKATLSEVANAVEGFEKDIELIEVIWVDDHFIAVGGTDIDSLSWKTGESVILSSTNGEYWDLVYHGYESSLQGVSRFSNGVVAVGFHDPDSGNDDAGIIVTWTGMDWEVSYPEIGDLIEVASDSQKILVFSYWPNRIFESELGLNWKVVVDSPIAPDLENVVYCGNYYLGCEYSDGWGGNGPIYLSEDGYSWKKVIEGVNNTFNLVSGSELIVAVAGNSIFTSEILADPFSSVGDLRIDLDVKESEVRFWTVPDQYYRIMGSENLVNWFALGNFQGDGTQKSLEFTRGGFFRLDSEVE